MKFTFRVKVGVACNKGSDLSEESKIVLSFNFVLTIDRYNVTKKNCDTYFRVTAVQVVLLREYVFFCSIHDCSS